jgi:hypothetical protein
MTTIAHETSSALKSRRPRRLHYPSFTHGGAVCFGVCLPVCMFLLAVDAPVARPPAASARLTRRVPGCSPARCR